MRYDDAIDIRQPVRDICRRLDLDETYVCSITIVPGRTNVELYLGRDGRCIGPKHIDPATGHAAMDAPLEFKTLS